MSIFDDPTEARLIANSILENPDDWSERGEYCILHTSGLQVWVGNGAWGLKPYKSDFRFEANSRGRRLIWKAYVSWRRDQLAKVLTKPNERSSLEASTK